LAYHPYGTKPNVQQIVHYFNLFYSPKTWFHSNQLAKLSRFFPINKHIFSWSWKYQPKVVVCKLDLQDWPDLALGSSVLELGWFHFHLLMRTTR
jgi:hypothetical protein